MLKITPHNEPIHVSSLCLLIYGDPGVGKTSTGFTAETPLLLDFDRGAYRSNYRKDSVQIDTWADVADLSAGDLEPYQTICVDTVGRLLDCLSAKIIADNPIMRGYGGALSLQGYGVLKAEYAGWLNTLRSYGKDVVLIAHDREDKNGEDILVRPDIQGGSYGEVFKRADGVAYLHKAGRDTVLDFSPTDRWVGKNSGGFDTLVVPNFASKPDFLATVIADTKAALNALSEAQVAALKAVEEWRGRVDQFESTDDINQAIADCGELEGPVLAQVKRIIADKAAALGYAFDKQAGAYKEAA